MDLSSIVDRVFVLDDFFSPTQLLLVEQWALTTPHWMLAKDQISLLAYIGEDTDGDLLLYDKDDRERMADRVGFQPNRVVVMDGSIPHQARAPSDDRFRMSIIIRGRYQCLRSAR